MGLIRRFRTLMEKRATTSTSERLWFNKCFDYISVQ